MAGDDRKTKLPRSKKRSPCEGQNTPIEASPKDKSTSGADKSKADGSESRRPVLRLQQGRGPESGSKAHKDNWTRFAKKKKR